MAQRPQAEKGMLCPMHRVDVSKVCHKCPWFTQIRGKHPQTGADVDEWACAISWMPMLMIEASQQTRQAGAAIESFRNEMTNVGTSLVGIASQTKSMKLIG